ncbi:unnamed protein product [Ascophyllum nodosum]
MFSFRWWTRRVWVVAGVVVLRPTLKCDAEREGLKQNLIEEGVGLHQKGDLEGAAKVYSRLLKGAPNDRDGLVLLGLAFYGRGKLSRAATAREEGITQGTRHDDNLATTATARETSEGTRLVESAVKVASSKEDALQIRGILGEVLRAKGDLDDAVFVLRGALAEEGWGADDTYQRQASVFLATTLIDIIDRDFSVSRWAEASNLFRESSWGRSTENAINNMTSGTSDRTLENGNEWDIRSEAEALLRGALAAKPSDKAATTQLATLLKSNWERIQVEGDLKRSDDDVDNAVGGRMNDWGSEALLWFERALRLDSSDAAVTLEYAVALHRLGREEEAERGYKQVIAMEKSSQGGARDLARCNLASLLHERGDLEGAVKGYRALLRDSPRSAIVLNNLGTVLLSLEEGHQEGLAMLDEALSLEPSNVEIMMNVGLQSQDSGDLDRARTLYLRRKWKRNDGLAVRRAIMLPPVMLSEDEIDREKARLAQAVEDLIHRDPPLVIPDPVRGLERVQFYLVYRGGNHRELQQNIARMHTLASPMILSVSPALQDIGRVKPSSGANTVSTTTGFDGLESGIRATKTLPLRVGFVSKFFGDEEPHGMLLEGIIRHLPREHFHVTVCPIAHPKARLSPVLADAADEVVKLPGKLRASKKILGELMLDVLVYADMNSEPISHFLGFSRLARVQAAFWGNPITTGIPSIDYFISAEVMEPQNRTMLSENDEAYSEQVVLLGGQGIWYEQPIRAQSLGRDSPAIRGMKKAELRRHLKSKLGLEEDSLVYMCPQSLFKLRPAFDLVLRDIIQAFADRPHQESSATSTGIKASRKAYVVLIEGRRKRWTEELWRRLEASVPEIISQAYRAKQTTSAGAAFHSLLASADVLLHPFPFGGSKTAADGLSLGVPVVAMEGSALPGRMAYSLYRTMGLDGPMNSGCCVARDREGYVQLAVRLGRDARYRRWAGDLIDRRSEVLWDRREVVLGWARFLARAGGHSNLTPEEVKRIKSTNLLPTLEPQIFSKTSQQEAGYSPGKRCCCTRRIESKSLDLSPSNSPLKPPPRGGLLKLVSVAVEALPVGTKPPAAVDERISKDETRLRCDIAALDHDVIPARESGRFSLHAETGRVVAWAGFNPASRKAIPARRPPCALESWCLHTAIIPEAPFRDSRRIFNDIIEGEHDNTKLSILLERFPLLHRQGKLENAVEVLKRALGIMGGRRKSHGRANRVGAYDSTREDGTVESVFPLDDEANQESEVLERDEEAIARVMNDLGCTLQQQLWRLEEAESMLRRAIARRPRYVSAMTNLGVTLQANRKMDEAEFWYREALRLATAGERDACLSNLVLLMRANGDRLEEAINLIASEVGLAPLRQEGLVAAILSLLQPRSLHKQAFRNLEKREGYTFPIWHRRGQDQTAGLWEEVTRLRENYLLSINNLVVFLGHRGNLAGVYKLLRDVAGMEPIFYPADERALLPPELHSPWHYFDSSGARSSREARHRNRHAIHLVTHYYLPQDARRASEIDLCLVRNLQNPSIGTVHLLVDHPDAAPSAETSTSIRQDVGSADSGEAASTADASWEKTEWIPPVLRSVDTKLADKATVVSLGRRMTFRDAIEYSNHVLDRQVVIVANSDIFFDETLLRLGSPATLDMEGKVFALGAWKSKLVPSKTGSSGVSFDIGSTTLAPESDFIPRIDSQDAWIFRSPLSGSVKEASDFEMGRPRCDGRLAQVLTDAGYTVTNPSLSLVAHHLHSSHSDSVGNSGGAVQRGFRQGVSSSAFGANDTTEEGHSEGYSQGYAYSKSRGTYTYTYSGDTQVTGKTAYVLISDRWLF